MRCQLQRLILNKFSYLEEPSLSVDGRHKIYEEVTRLVHPDPQLTTAVKADSIEPVDEFTHDNQKLTAEMHLFVITVHKVGSICEKPHETKSAVSMVLHLCAYDEPIADSEDALSCCKGMGYSAT